MKNVIIVILSPKALFIKDIKKQNTKDHILYETFRKVNPDRQQISG